MITLLKSPLKNSANNIIASPQTRMVKALDFDKKSEYKKFIKWIDSSTKDLEKIKIPSKKEIKKLEKLVLEMDGGGGGGLGGLLGLIPSILFPGFGGPDIPFISRPKPPKGKPKPKSSKGGGPKVPKLNPKSLGKLNDSFSRYISGKSNFGDRLRLFRRGNIGASGLFTKGGFNAQGALKGQGFKLPGFGGGKPQAGATPNLGSATKAGGFLKNAGGVARRSSGPLSLLFAGLDYSERKSEGQTETQAIGGAASTAVGGAVAGSLATAIALTVIPEPSTTVAGLIMLGSLAASYFGGKAAGSLSDKITGANKKIDANKKISEDKQKSENQFSSVLKTFGEAVDGLLTFAQGRTSDKKEGPLTYSPSSNLQHLLYGAPKEGGGYEYTDPDTGITLTRSSSYGKLRGNKIHKGEDITAQVGTPLRAISDGEIVDSDYENGWGNFLVFRDDKGVHHLYGHMQEGYKRGGPVKKGDIIGKVGMTGRTSGPHLHWETGTGWNGGQITGRFDPLSAYTIQQPFFTSRSKPGEESSQLSAPSVPAVRPAGSLEAQARVSASQIASGRQQTVIITQGQGGGPQVIPQQIPIPIPMGGGGGGVAVASIPEVVLLNSLWNTLLLTKLSST